ncbi:MAG: DUF6763 family protein [Aquisalimonadaceae bacterium]
MATQYQPEIGDWYESIMGDLFEVVALDLEDETIEIQYFDGAIEELDLETWNDLEIIPAEAPEDFTGSLDMAREDTGVNDQPPSLDIQSPLDGVDFDI